MLTPLCFSSKHKEILEVKKEADDADLRCQRDDESINDIITQVASVEILLYPMMRWHHEDAIIMVRSSFLDSKF
jgi:hypothetical protein